MVSFADLFRFLAELGKTMPFAVTHRTMARRWQYVSAMPASIKTLTPSALGKLLEEDGSLPWRPIYARVSGDLPLDEPKSATEEQPILVRCEIDVVTPGRFSFALNNTDGITLWLDGKSLAPQPTISADLSRGGHTFTFRVDLHARKDRNLRLELIDAAGSNGQARFRDGR